MKLDPEPWIYLDGCREDWPRHLGDESPGHASVIFAPREGYEQDRAKYPARTFQLDLSS